MKAVLDTNVLVSGVISAGGPCGQIVELLLDGAIELFVDGRILDEYETVLRRPELSLPAEYVEFLLTAIRLEAKPVTARPLPAALSDPDDIPFLETAAAAGALLVTGDRRHFPSGMTCGVKVVAPREFLNMLRSLSGEPF